MRLGIAISRAAAVEPTWTTAHIAEAMLAAGHTVRFIEPWDFEVDRGGRLVARAHAFDPRNAGWTRDEICQALKRRLARRCFVEVARLDVLLLRINPLDTAVVTFALQAEAEGVTVLNPPGTVLLTSHKAYLAGLRDVPRPATLITRSRGAAHAFAAEQPQGVVVKPARASGGRGIFRVHPGAESTLEVAMDRVTHMGDGYAVVQAYLPEADQGEKRLVWLNGQLLGGYLRERAPGEFRHNLKQGATPKPVDMTERDHELSALLTPHLLARGVWLAGVDVIGGQVVEVNTLNPGGLHLIRSFSSDDLAGPVVESLLSRRA
jgi:glutathione synthase